MAVRSYHYVNDFWLKYFTLDEMFLQERIRFKWTRILKILRQLKQNVDAADVDRVRDRYGFSEAFSEHFFYRKGNKLLPLKNPAYIAWKLQKMEGNP